MAERHLGKHQILEEIGKGGFATVYRAQDLDLSRSVALKVLDPVLTRDPVWVARFRREARAVASLDHPRIVTVHEIGQAEGVLYIAMKLVEGGSLAERLKQAGGLPWPEVVRMVEQIAEALDFAHAQGVLHRDLKPANVLLDRRTGAVLTDFGFARLVADNSLSVSMSGASGGIVGTPAYIAPEIWEGEDPAVQTDVYALGCILYEMATGQVLFTGHSAPAVMRAHFQPRKLPESWPEGVPPGLREVLETALALDPAARYGQAGELAAAVAALTLDRLAEPYAVLQAAIAANEWQEAVALAGQIRAQNPDYRDVTALEQQAFSGLAEAARQREAAETALAEGDLKGAERAVRQWQRLAPDDPAATAFLVQVEGKRQAVESALRQAEVESAPPAAEVADAKLAVQDAQGGETTPKGQPVLSPVVPIAEPEIERQGSYLQDHPSSQDTLPPAQRADGSGDKSRSRSRNGIVIGLIALLVMAVVAGTVVSSRKERSTAAPTTVTPAPPVRLQIRSALYFVSDQSGKREVYRMNADGKRVQVTHTPGQSEGWSPVQGPNGSLYFTSDRSGKREIHRLDSAGKSLQVTNTPNPGESWSPTFGPGDTLYFASDRTGKNEIYRLDSTGKSVRVTNTPNAGESWSPAVGPRGDLFMTSNRDGKLEIYRLDGAGKAVRVTNTPGPGESWEPAVGTRGELYFTSNRDGKREIYQLDEAGKSVRVTHSKGNAEAWAPLLSDGRLFFNSDRDGKAEVYSIDKSGQVAPVTKTPDKGESWWSSED